MYRVKISIVIFYVYAGSGGSGFCDRRDRNEPTIRNYRFSARAKRVLNYVGKYYIPRSKWAGIVRYNVRRFQAGNFISNENTNE